MRQEGWYWLKWPWGWTIHKWNGKTWDYNGDQAEFVHSLIEIDERQIVRTEPKIYPKCPDAHCEYTGECQESFIKDGKCKMNPPSSDFIESQKRREKPKMSKEQITKAEELISDTIRKVDKLFGLL